MIECFFWVLLGLLSGWIGYLSTRTTGIYNNLLYPLTGVISALLVGLATRNIGILDTSRSPNFNLNNILLTFAASGICVAIVGLLGSARQPN